MKQQIRNIRRELEACDVGLERFDYERDYPAQMAFADGYELGLERALAMLEGDSPWLGDECGEWYKAHVARYAEGL